MKIALLPPCVLLLTLASSPCQAKEKPLCIDSPKEAKSFIENHHLNLTHEQELYDTYCGQADGETNCIRINPGETSFQLQTWAPIRIDNFNPVKVDSYSIKICQLHGRLQIKIDHWTGDYWINIDRQDSTIFLSGDYKGQMEKVKLYGSNDRHVASAGEISNVVK